ncbi:hypothetical protein C2G38_2062492 [Gigaspora rosea]|uniref:Uncharacterized protein n=1 Tax=Gigaspora rosea TaxID=44941 RepID=A0A397VZM9_9GLOM|nr:hypothetical protein C2G38_2062492 [Gigaspora rosea]
MIYDSIKRFHIYFVPQYFKPVFFQCIILFGLFCQNYCEWRSLYASILLTFFMISKIELYVHWNFL